MTASGTLLGALRDFFTAEEWPYDEVDDASILHLVFRSEHVEFDCYAETVEADSIVLFYSRAPFDVPDDRRPAAAEYVTRVNDGLPIGNLELSYATGSIRCKTSLDVPAGLLDAAWLRGIVGANLAVMEHYLVGLRAVVFAGADPARVAADLDAR